VSVPERKEAAPPGQAEKGRRRRLGKRRDKRKEAAASLISRSGTEGRLLKRPCSAVLPDFTSKNVETSETNVKTA